jgi:hypothetical protein
VHQVGFITYKDYQDARSAKLKIKKGVCMLHVLPQELLVIYKVVGFDTNIMIVDASGWESAASDKSDSDEESDLDNDSDGGTANVTPAAKVTQPQQKQQGSTRSYKKRPTKKKETPKQYSSAEVISCLNEVIGAGKVNMSS